MCSLGFCAYMFFARASCASLAAFFFCTTITCSFNRGQNASPGMRMTLVDGGEGRCTRAKGCASHLHAGVMYVRAEAGWGDGACRGVLCGRLVLCRLRRMARTCFFCALTSAANSAQLAGKSRWLRPFSLNLKTRRTMEEFWRL